MTSDNSKVSKKDAEYRPSPNGQQSCGKCTMFIQPDGCDTVAGKIVSAGWCSYYEAKKGADE